jgi:hypothetical protein
MRKYGFGYLVWLGLMLLAGLCLNVPEARTQPGFLSDYTFGWYGTNREESRLGREDIIAREGYCPTGGCVLSPTTPGLGNSDYAFQVSADEVATLGSFGTANRIGVAATFTGATGGPESIFLGAGPALGGGGGGGVAGGGAVPESDTAVLLGGGLIAFAVALKWRNGKRVPRARSQRSWGL